MHFHILLAKSGLQTMPSCTEQSQLLNCLGNIPIDHRSWPATNHVRRPPRCGQGFRVLQQPGAAPEQSDCVRQ